MGTHRFQVNRESRLSWLEAKSPGNNNNNPQALFVSSTHMKIQHNLLFQWQQLVLHYVGPGQTMLLDFCDTSMPPFSTWFPHPYPQKIRLQTLVTFGVSRIYFILPSYRLHLELDLFVGSLPFKGKECPIHLAPQHLKHQNQVGPQGEREIGSLKHTCINKPFSN